MAVTYSELLNAVARFVVFLCSYCFLSKGETSNITQKKWTFLTSLLMKSPAKCTSLKWFLHLWLYSRLTYLLESLCFKTEISLHWFWNGYSSTSYSFTHMQARINFSYPKLSLGGIKWAVNFVLTSNFKTIPTKDLHLCPGQKKNKTKQKLVLTLPHFHSFGK